MITLDSSNAGTAAPPPAPPLATLGISLGPVIFLAKGLAADAGLAEPAAPLTAGLGLARGVRCWPLFSSSSSSSRSTSLRKPLLRALRALATLLAVSA